MSKRRPSSTFSLFPFGRTIASSSRSVLVFNSFLVAIAIIVVRPLVGATAAEANPALREWAVGETVDADIVVPAPLAIVDPEQTTALRQIEAQRVPPVYRYDGSVSAMAESELRARFKSAREGFLDLLEAGFQQRVLRVLTDLSDARFAETILVFRSKNAGFPLSTNLAELWALGDAGTVVLDDLVAKLRRSMGGYLRIDRFADGERVTATSVRLIPAENLGTNSGRVSGSVPLRGTNVPRASVVALGRYRRELIGLAPEDDREYVSFVAGFLRANCSFDSSATILARERRVQDINSVDRYEAGVVIARKGMVVDAKTKLALDALRASLQATRATESAVLLQADLNKAQRQAAELQLGQQRASALASAERARGDATEIRNRRLLFSLVGTFVLLLVFVALWWRYRGRQRRLEQSAGWSMVSAEAGADVWRERALAAEARADRATAILKTNLLPHMARWMMSELVQRLLSQRSSVRQIESRAEIEVAELAQRLERLQAPLEERLRAYEHRISELEAELAAKDQENRQLIQARIESTRRKLESERSAEGAWN